MLEAMRRHSRGTIIYVLFGILIAVFIINFGPGSSSGGCGAGLVAKPAARVAGQSVSEQEYRLYYVAVRGPSFPVQVAKQYRVKESIMDKIIERELLAQEAERMGFNVSEKEAEDLVAQGRMMILGIPRKFDDIVGGAFDYKRFRSFCESLGVTVSRFIEVQRRELLADKVRTLMKVSIKVPAEEVRSLYDQRETQANLQFVRFLPRQFEGDVEVSPEEIAAYQKDHDKELRDTYKEREFLFKKLDKQARVRRILVAVDKDEKDEDVVAKAEKKANKALKKVSGEDAQDFAKVAKDMSDDDATKAKGGDMGWHKKGYTGLGETLDKQIFDAKAGDVLGPVRSDKGFEVLKVEGFREGDVPFEQVAGDLAEEKLRADKAKAKAKEAADEAIEKARGGEDLATLYPKPGEDESDPAKKVNAPPHVEETGSFPRRGDLVPQIGISPELMKKAFEMKQGEVAGPFDVTGSWVVVKLKERKEPDKDFFEKHKDEQARQVETQKWEEALDSWTKQRCIEVNTERPIFVNASLLTYDTEQPETPYTPCGGNKP